MEINDYIKEGFETVFKECGKKIAENKVDEVRTTEEIEKLKGKTKPEFVQKRKEFEQMKDNSVKMQKYYTRVFQIVKEQLGEIG